MTDAEMNTLTDRLIGRIYTSDYPGTYRLGSSSPSGDYDVHLADVFEDTRTDGNSVTFSIYQRQSMTAPTARRPVSIKRSSGGSGTFQGIQEMTDQQIRETYGQLAKTRVMNGSNGVGTYLLLSSTQGDPSNQGYSGTWVAKGTATDTRNLVEATSYSRTRSSNYARTFEGNYSRDFAGNYSRDFVGNYSRIFTGNYGEGFVGNFTRTFVGDYTRGFVGNYSRNFEGNYARAFTRESTRTRVSNYLRTSTRSRASTYQRDSILSRVSNYTRDSQRTRISNYTRTSTRTRASNYTRDFARTRTSNYTQDFTRTRTSAYSDVYTRTRASTYTRDSQRTRISSYTRESTRSSRSSNYLRTKAFKIESVRIPEIQPEQVLVTLQEYVHQTMHVLILVIRPELVF